VLPADHIILYLVLSFISIVGLGLIVSYSYNLFLLIQSYLLNKCYYPIILYQDIRGNSIRLQYKLDGINEGYMFIILI
jgi:hypothetical protein